MRASASCAAIRIATATTAANAARALDGERSGDPAPPEDSTDANACNLGDAVKWYGAYPCAHRFAGRCKACQEGNLARCQTSALVAHDLGRWWWLAIRLVLDRNSRIQLSIRDRHD